MSGHIPKDKVPTPGGAAPTRDFLVVRLEILGRVQGVGYRDWLQDNALALGLTGWVRNRRDGSVEALVQGAPTKVEALVGQCRQGPPAARVDAVHRHAATPEDLSGFQRRATV